MKQKAMLGFEKITPLNLSFTDFNNLFFSAIPLLCKARWQLHLAACIILLYNFFNPFGNTQVPKSASCQMLGIVFPVQKNDYAKKLLLAEWPKKSSHSH